MSNFTKPEFAVLDISRKNYQSWILDIELYLQSKNLVDAINENHTANTQDKATTMIFIRRHLHESLKTQYLMVKDPLTLWKNLKEQYDHQKTVVLSRAQYNWHHLRLQDFKKDSYVEVGVSCNEGESVSVAEPNLCDPKTFPSLNGAKIDSFGLWKQVAYGRNGRNAGGSNFGGKKPSNVDTLGKSNSTTKAGSGPSSYGVESFGKGMGNRRMMERVPAVVSGRKVVYPSKNGKPGISVIEGSRFAVLSDDVVDNTSSNKVLNKSMDKGKGISNSVLSEISNRVLSRKKKASLSPNKYLQNAGTDYCRTTIPLKENICGEGIKFVKRDLQVWLKTLRIQMFYEAFI
ncbi:hypothetical protein LWI29_035226 [Acer saccharum]|uniref:Uncharacterized protein n=1 Tax=Acer saccharum TaxID=4024 RepID=A0AA39TF47_ACESA|nr:hypothetical protein LWI29_035226 [Acer saccharum]